MIPDVLGTLSGVHRCFIDVLMVISRCCQDVLRCSHGILMILWWVFHAWLVLWVPCVLVGLVDLVGLVGLMGLLGLSDVGPKSGYVGHSYEILKLKLV